MFGKRSDETRPAQGLPLGGPAGASPAALSAPAAAIPDLPMPGTSFGGQQARPQGGAAQQQGSGAVSQQPPKKPEAGMGPRKSENYYDIKSTIFNALIDAIDLT